MNQLKKYAAAVAVAAISVCSTAVFCESPASAASSGWYVKDGKKHYAAADGSDVIGETVIDGVRYLFAPNGVLQTGWQTVEGKRWYFDADGNAVFGWIEWRGEQYYIDKEQGKVTAPGIVVLPDAEDPGAFFDEFGVISPEWYSLATDAVQSCSVDTGCDETGAEEGALTEGGILPIGFAEEGPAESEPVSAGEILGIQQDASGITRYIGADGEAVNGWIETAAGWIYADEGRGVLTGEQYLDNIPYLFGEDGCALSGFQTLSDGKTRWFTGTPEPLKTGWMQDGTGSAVYYFDNNGVMAAGRNILIDGVSYAFSENTAESEDTDYPQYGRLITGFDTADGKTCYYAPDGKAGEGLGAMVTGWTEIGGAKYHFSWDGTMAVGRASVDGRWYMFAENGTMQTGWIEDAENTYYYDPETGAALTGVQEIGGEQYRFDDFGVLQIEEPAAETPAMTYWQQIDGKDYYFGADDVMAAGDVVIDGVTYHFSENGEYLGADFKFTAATDAIVKGAERAEEPIRSLVIYDHGTRYCMTRDDFPTETLSIMPGFTLKDADIEIIEKFAAEHFASSMSITEKLYVTLQWIHMNVNYAYDYTPEVYRPSFVDTIFNNKLGQCIQYNGAMASVLAYYGFDAYVVKGCTKSGSQHFWCEVKIGDQRYYLETGNFGKNGNWQYFFLPVNG
ncbi:MAG: hypothetical protein IK130_07015 [Oscillospiraceae bacterium]|nr:hypothetical protein [Oscillospiraceae bacterium]